MDGLDCADFSPRRGGAGQHAEKTRTVSVQGRGAGKKGALAEATHSWVSPQKLAQKVPEAPGPEHPRPTADRRTVHIPSVTGPSPRTPPMFTANAMAFFLPLRNFSFLAIPGAQITSPFPLRLGRKTGNWALHEREGSTSVTARLWALPSSSESWLWCLGNSGKVWNRKGRYRDPASPSAPCFLSACPEAE